MAVAQKNKGEEIGKEERTLILVKPDGVERGLVGEILQRFEKRGYKFVGLKGIVASKVTCEAHYEHVKGKPWFGAVIKHMTSGPIVAIVFKGRDIVSQAREMLGSDDPLESQLGTIRRDLGKDIINNVCHASDSIETAEKEIKEWFAPNEIFEVPSIPPHADDKSDEEELSSRPTIADGDRRMGSAIVLPAQTAFHSGVE